MTEGRWYEVSSDWWCNYSTFYKCIDYIYCWNTSQSSANQILLNSSVISVTEYCVWGFLSDGVQVYLLCLFFDVRCFSKIKLRSKKDWRSDFYYNKTYVLLNIILYLSLTLLCHTEHSTLFQHWLSLSDITDACQEWHATKHIKSSSTKTFGIRNISKHTVLFISQSLYQVTKQTWFYFCFLSVNYTSLWHFRI